MSPAIRLYTPSDKADCLSSFISNVPSYFTQEEVPEFESFLNRLEQPHTKTIFYVVVNEGKIMGCGGFGDKYNTGILSLAWGLIHRDYHKMGFGKLLLQHRLNQIKLLHPGCPVIVDTTQFSFGFFEKFGFETLKITSDYYTKGMHRYDMKWEPLD